MIKRKYNNKKIIVDGIKFDSKKEALRYKELKMLEKAGIISNLQRQVNNKGKPKKGRLIERECTYYADFVYMQNDNTIVEDVKGYRDGQAYNLFVIKRKLMLYVHGIIIKEL